MTERDQLATTEPEEHAERSQTMQENATIISESLSENIVPILTIAILGYLGRRWIVRIVLGAVFAVFAVGLATVLAVTM